MSYFTYKKHSNSWLIKCSLKGLCTIPLVEVQKIVHDVTNRFTVMGLDQNEYTFLVSRDDENWSIRTNGYTKVCCGVFVSTEQEAIDILYLINKARMWNLLKR